jgi:hypothetical protein
MIYKRIFLSLFLLSFIHQAFGQKLYIWCPVTHEIIPHTGFLKNQDVNVVIFDGRNIPSNSKIECDSRGVTDALKAYIEKVYPSSNIKILPDSMYYQSSTKGVLTIKIGIAAYQAGFGTDISVGIGSVGGKFSYSVFPQGQWNGLVSYFVQIFDNRGDNKKKVSKEISEITTKSNLWGYKTARSCLYSSYDKANTELLSFIEDSLME